MKLARGDMWEVWDEADLFLITTNSKLKANGALVMGAGIAKQARDKFTGVDKALGRSVAAAGKTYGLLVSERWPVAKLGAFQSKQHWRETASLSLIALGAQKLKGWCDANPEATVHLNMPGVGLGGLQEADVLPLLEPLSDRVTLWRR